MANASKLAELRRLRESGKTRRDLEFDEEAGKIYDEVDEREFEQHQRERLRGDNFVDDDDGRGYVDTGAYEWDSHVYGSSQEEEETSKRRTPKRKADKSDGDIATIFRTQKRTKPVAAPVTKPVSLDIDALMNDLTPSRPAATTPTTRSTPSRLGVRRSALGSLGAKWLPKRVSETPTKVRSDRDASSPTQSEPITLALNTTTPLTSTTIKPEPVPEPVPSSEPSEPTVNMQPVALEAQELAEIELPSSPLPDTHADASMLTPTPSDDEGAFNSTGWLLASDEPESEVKDAAADDVAAGESFRFFWTDHWESPDQRGSLTLFGRTPGGQSVTVVVRNAYRVLHVLPSVGSTTDDVAEELSAFFFRQTQRGLPAMPVELRDCFVYGKPTQTYLKVLAPFVRTPLPSRGKTYSEVRGTSATAIESLLISRKIMGPGWLDVRVKAKATAAGWTQLGVECDSPLHIKPVSEAEAAALGTPKFTMMSLAITTVPDANKGHEVVSISARVFRSVDDAAKDATALVSTLHTGIRPPQGVFPPGFKEEVAKHNALRSGKPAQGGKVAVGKAVSVHNSERALLSWFFALLRRTDPDMLIGHALTDVHLATILSRAIALRDPMMSSLGRVRSMPTPTQASPWALARLASGRLLVDLKNKFGMELVSRVCREYTLDEMAKEVLFTKRKYLDTNLHSGTFLRDGADGLLEVVRRSEYDTLYVASIALKNQMLPLSRQLTNLCGSPWRTTLVGHRSERNDYLLMHEFARDGNLIPERPSGGSSSGDDGYVGGHVFEPVAGLHQTCVLVMDFNSLYPSIIQEYNICFTTVDCTAATDEAEEPPSTTQLGLLPRLLKELVERRRAVKSLMKDPKATPAQQAAWEIRQTALKLTANSMYGCLGQASSRFAARPLAKLITLKGRQALAQTKRLAEDNGMRVLYGDTDSVMIHTAATKYHDAFVIGQQFKQLVNAQYKYMEIDVDNVFRQLFLYKKKKYAAVVLSPQNETKLEYKGLDIVRREFSDVCKVAFRQSLHLLFGLDTPDEIADPLATLEQIYTYLAEYSGELRAGQLAPRRFVIRHQLSKELDQYQKLDMPQLVVAKAKVDAGGTVKAKDVIGYVIAAPTSEADDRPQIQRAVAFEDLVAKKLTPDFGFYVHHQVYTPIKRLLDVVDGFDAARLADVMGVEGEKPRASAAAYDLGVGNRMNFVTLGDPRKRFEACERLVLKAGDETFEFRGLAQLSPLGVAVPSRPGDVLDYADVAAQVDVQLAAYINRYYRGWLECDDCKCFTRSVSTFVAKRCPQPGCAGSLAPTFSARRLNEQLSYVKWLFDAARLDDAKVANAAIYSAKNQAGLKLVVAVCDKYLRRSGYSRVKIGQYFNF